MALNLLGKEGGGGEGGRRPPPGLSKEQLVPSCVVRTFTVGDASIGILA